MARCDDKLVGAKSGPSNNETQHLQAQVQTNADSASSPRAGIENANTNSLSNVVEDVSSSSDNSSSQPSSTAPSQSSSTKPTRRLGNFPFNLSDSSSARDILAKFLPGVSIPSNTDEAMLWSVVFDLFNDMRCKRNKLKQYNTLEDAVELIKKSAKIIVLSGAGISTSSGIPDFRSRDGVYARLHVDFPDLPDPKAMFDIGYFRHNPRPFFKFAKEIYPGQFQPAIGHKFIKSLEKHNKLLRNYSQNIDTLEQQAGITKVIECHGSFATASCTRCKYSVDCEAIRRDIEDQKIPLCPRCSTDDMSSDELAVMKPDIVFFGEGLSDLFHETFERDKDQVDLLIVIGSSMKVKPVALIPSSVPKTVPQILINREPLEHLDFDIELLGDCDDIIQELCLRLGDGWSEICCSSAKILEPLEGSLEEILLSLMSGSKSVNNLRDNANDDSDEITKCEDTQQSKSTSDNKNIEGNKNELEDESYNHNQINNTKSLHEECTSSSVGETSHVKMIEELEGECSGTTQPASNKVESSNQENSDEDWEDVESSSSSPSSSSDQSFKINREDIVQVPKSSFLFLSPSRYIFKGAEVTKSDIEMYASQFNDNNSHE